MVCYSLVSHRPGTTVGLGGIINIYAGHSVDTMFTVLIVIAPYCTMCTPVSFVVLLAQCLQRI